MGEITMIEDRSPARIVRGARWLISFLWGKTLVGALLIGAAIGLAGLASWPPRPGADASHIGPPGSGITVWIEVADIWIPKTLHELARRHSEASIPLSHEELQLHLKREGAENLWYAVRAHHLQVDGRVSEITTIDYVDQSPASSRRFLDLLDTIDGSQPRSPGSAVWGSKVHIIPEALLNREPRVAVEELLSQSRARDE